jgi:hypothetical protein
MAIGYRPTLFLHENTRKNFTINLCDKRATHGVKNKRIEL